MPHTAIKSPMLVPYPHSQGVIDIGSNSVRMMVYHAPVRVPLPLFNEKYYCGLGKGLSTTGKLNAQGKDQALKALDRFMVMAKRLCVHQMTVLATAAIRDASDGKAFVKKIESQTGLKVEVISGNTEAELAAKGVMASFYAPDGISADLGGGSVELAHIKDQTIKDCSSCEVGVLRMADLGDRNVEGITDLIQKNLGSVKWLKQSKAPLLYAVGGSFRSIAKMHMKLHSYPLPILHEYRLVRRHIDEIVALFSSMTLDEIGDLPGIPSKRAGTMLPAAMMLQQIMQIADIPRVVFSVSGIREGLLYERLSSKHQKIDPLFASAADLALLAGRHGRYADELFQWMQPLFIHESAQHERLRYALCVLSELAWTVDPNFRSEWAYNRVVQSSIKGVTHRERVMLAMALYHRYQVKWRQDRREMVLLDERDRLWAQCVGIAANLAFHLSGGQQGNLHHGRLDVSAGMVTLSLDKEAKPLRTETLEKRLEGLGSSFNALSNFVI